MRDVRRILIELEGALATRHFVRIVPLSILAPLISLWPHIGSPFVPAAVAAMLTVEPFVNNTLALWPGRLTSLGILPADPVRTVRVMNAATGILTVVTALWFGVLVSYVQPVPPSAADIARAAMYLATILFPLLIAGNILSVQQVRDSSGWGLQDAAAGLTILLTTAVVSLPWLLLHAVPGGAIMLAAVIITGAALWWHHSTPRTAVIILEQFPELWQNIHPSSR